ncbi:MAG: SMC-Scp complex subunit ScpB [candidate division WOR-3 bacterium]|nr:SMC-Scp complex subunit ScpB [candidate division WOR-3 bacterium]
MDDNIEMNENNILDDVRPGENTAKEIVEALMIATTEPLPLGSIAEIVNLPEATVRAYIEELNNEYGATGRAFEIKEIAGGFQIYTLPKFAEWVGALHKRKERLSKAALETLAIVAYHQPIIRADIEKIRGVDSTSVLDTLIQKNLIRTCGRLPSPGRPIKYGTTKEFLRYFGIKDINELPNEEDFGDRVMGGYPDMPKTEPDKIEEGDDLRLPEPQDFEGDKEPPDGKADDRAEDSGEDIEDEFVDFGDDDGRQDEPESQDKSVSSTEDNGETDMGEDEGGRDENLQP